MNSNLKLPTSQVCRIAKEVERLLVEKLSELLPTPSFITEEGTVDFTKNEYYWVIDPLDGTTNFIHNNAPYCLSIALTYKSAPIVGVIYEGFMAK